jgi:hypothetical protein
VKHLVAQETADGWPTSPRKSFEDFEDGFLELPAEFFQSMPAVRAGPPKGIPGERENFEGIPW